MNLLDKILSLRKAFTDRRADYQEVGAIDGWMEEAKRLMLIKSLAEHDGVKYVTQIFKGEVEGINKTLLTDDSSKLPDSKRDRLLDRRDLAKKYLDLFDGVERDLSTLENQVDEEITNLV